MRNFKSILVLGAIFMAFLATAQPRQSSTKVKVTGKVIEKTTNQPLEYATIYASQVDKPTVNGGGITDEKGQFEIELVPGTYNIKIDFISFTPIEIKNKSITTDINLGSFTLSEDATVLGEIEIRAERSTVDIRLDKKVYSVGQDMIVKGGTISDVLDNVPSVSVDVEGNVSLRGNDNVRILIDGKPSGLAGLNIADALKMLPADTIDKVEVITNPSARYEAEGGGGIINIILKKGKTGGLNGSLTGTIGDPTNTGLSGNLNFKGEKFNLFTNQGYSNRKNLGSGLNDITYKDPVTGEPQSYLEERRNSESNSKSYNGNVGIDLFLTENLTWTNVVSYRKNSRINPSFVSISEYDLNGSTTARTARNNAQDNNSESVDYSTNFTQKFKKQGHTLSLDASTSLNKWNDYSLITMDDLLNDLRTDTEQNSTIQKQNRSLVQLDYVLPIGENSQFEAGYRGNFTKLNTNFMVDDMDSNGDWIFNDNLSNHLLYKENVNALYTQYGTKFGKLNTLVGLRWEDTDINVNLVSQDFNRDKKYNNFFPSVFLNYELGNEANVSISYSKRISRPRTHSLNPFTSRSSNISVFRGNPDLDASLTDAFDLGFIKRWDKLTLNTSLYFNHTKDAEQYVRYSEEIDGINVLVSSPVNLGVRERLGFDFTLNYNAYRWWRINGSFNFYRNETKGDYTYYNLNNDLVAVNFDNTAYSWFTRVTNRMTFYKIDWQTNLTYNAPEENAQGRSKSIFHVNMALSKDVLKDKATIALNVSDLFNSRNRRSYTNLPTQDSYSEMMWRKRQVTLSFTYRFNKSKNDRDRNDRRGENNGGGEDMEFVG